MQKGLFADIGVNLLLLCKQPFYLGLITFLGICLCEDLLICYNQFASANCIASFS
jgi:hypothetical protein